MSPSEFYLWCSRHQGKNCITNIYILSSLSEEKSKPVPLHHRFSRAVLHRVGLQVRFTPFTLFYILFLLSSSHFKCCVVLLWNWMQRYFIQQKGTKPKNNPLWEEGVCWLPIHAKAKWLQIQAGFLPCLESSGTAKAVISVRQQHLQFYYQEKFSAQQNLANGCSSVFSYITQHLLFRSFKALPY